MVIKKQAIILIASLGLIFLVIGLYVFLKPAPKTINPLGNEKSEIKPEEDIRWQSWKDEAGFSFEYPAEAKVSTSSESEGDSYSNLEISSPDKPGKITILCQDSKYSTLDDWLKKEPSIKGANALDTKIASQSAKRLALANGQEKTAFIDQDGVIYLLTKQSEGEVYWNKIYSHLLSSFNLIPLPGESTQEFQDWVGDFSGGDEADLVEPVEIVQ